MNTYVALFKSVNVGGRNILPMKDLVEIFESMGFEAVETWVQSGNVVFQSAEPCSRTTADAISAAVLERHGFQPEVLLIGRPQFKKAVTNNPFDTSDGKSLHLFFLAESPKQPDLDALEAIRTRSEAFELIDKVFYLYAPDGIGSSKLVSRIERCLGTVATARNWNTVNKLMAMAER